VVLWLAGGALYFTLYLRFINLRGFRHGLELTAGRFYNPRVDGQLTRFQALSAALAGTVGLGNIAGVAVAITLGGPGATFWMIVAGFLGMSTKFVECTLGVKYREINAQGKAFGGPMHYLQKSLQQRGFSRTGKLLALLFALMCVGGSLGGGNMFQANQTYALSLEKFPFLEGKGFFFGLAFALPVGIVIVGGLRSIAEVTQRVVPFMCGIYVLAALVIIGANIHNLGPALWMIVEGAFHPQSIKGGFIGVLIIGFQRAAFSNEAGLGSSAIVHSAVRTNEPASEGAVALLEPFSDTVVVCTMTALILIFTGYATGPQELSGVALTNAAFSSVLPWFQWVLLVIVFSFAFSTALTWSYHGLQSWNFLFGRFGGSLAVELSYKILFLCCIVIGSSASLGSVLDFSDMMILCMSLPNFIGLFLLCGEVRREARSYFERLHRGEIARFSPG